MRFIRSLLPAALLVAHASASAQPAASSAPPSSAPPSSAPPSSAPPSSAPPYSAPSSSAPSTSTLPEATQPPPAPGARTALTIEQAVQLAMARQPALRQVRAQVEAARGRVDQAELARRPTVSVSTSGNAGGGGIARDFLGNVLRAGLNVGASASWRLYDFGLTATQVRAAELSARAAAAGVQTTTLDVRRNVEQSFLEAVARLRLVTVAEATVMAEAAHVDQARRFVAAQAKDPIEVVQAQARHANARSALAQARSSAAIALASLRAAIGWTELDQPLDIAAAWPGTPAEPPPPLARLVERARATRPELAQLAGQIDAAEATVEAARALRRPTLNATASTSWNPQTGLAELPVPAWSIGVALTWQALDGGRAAADARVARASREAALAQRDALLLSLTSELEAARAQIEATRVAIEAAREAVASARAQQRLAEARYAQGLGGQIELADAQTAVTTAEGNLIQSEWQLASAWAALRRAVGEP